MTLRTLSILALFALTACATAPLAPDRISTSEDAIRAAAEVGAGDLPQAALHLKLAEEQLALAKKVEKEGDSERAELLVQRSLADSALALALVRRAEAENDAAAESKAVRTIEGETP
jgi:pyridoxal biosynthesis lyase PdxS